MFTLLYTPVLFTPTKTLHYHADFICQDKRVKAHYCASVPKFSFFQRFDSKNKAFDKSSYGNHS